MRTTGIIHRIFLIDRPDREPGILCGDLAGRLIFLPDAATQDLLFRLTIAFPHATRLLANDSKSLPWLKRRGITIHTRRVAYLIEPCPTAERSPYQTKNNPAAKPAERIP